MDGWARMNRGTVCRRARRASAGKGRAAGAGGAAAPLAPNGRRPCRGFSRTKKDLSYPQSDRSGYPEYIRRSAPVQAEKSRCGSSPRSGSDGWDPWSGRSPPQIGYRFRHRSRCHGSRRGWLPAPMKHAPGSVFHARHPLRQALRRAPSRIPAGWASAGLRRRGSRQGRQA